MKKQKINLTIDKDLIEFAKLYAKEQRTTVSEMATQFFLNLKKAKNNDYTEIIISDPDFNNLMLETIKKIRTGKEKWYSYEEVFK
ncbi:MAG: DUF6364 family protein [Actinobacteria bacterium]|jgi:hypothetical protein|nr:DUF6364 family protein [Cyanobacteriota bacterium]MCL5772253.1 DUF6364 family protein [Actinomycetota bacterium]